MLSRVKFDLLRVIPTSIQWGWNYNEENNQITSQGWGKIVLGNFWYDLRLSGMPQHYAGGEN